jgi:hypothetical protein
MPRRRSLLVAVVAAGAALVPSVAQADDKSLATVSIAGAKALAVQEAQWSLAATKAAQDPSKKDAVVTAGDTVRQASLLLQARIAAETPSTDLGRQAKAKLLDALRSEYHAVGEIDDLIAGDATGAQAKQRLAAALKRAKAARREAAKAGVLLRRILAA